ncbi:MAG: Flp pilus assembly protein CpaB [Spirochaetes bacterium]|nr:Flp pilus assembly protein CpaB [Spirochaetota bacterium]
MSKKLSIIIAIFSALIAVFIIMGYITKVEEEAALDANLVTAVVAKKYISKFDLIQKDMVRIEKIPSKYLSPGSIRSTKELFDSQGRAKFITYVPILEDEVITSTKLTVPGGATGLSVVVPKGQRAIVIPVVEDALSGGLIKPGDKIDLIASFEDKTVILLQNLMILSVGQKILGEELEKRKKQGGLDLGLGDSGSLQSVTLAVTPEEALKISFARDKCRFNVALRNTLDNQIINIGAVNNNNLIGIPVSPKKSITIYEGGESIIKEFFGK